MKHVGWEELPTTVSAAVIDSVAYQAPWRRTNRSRADEPETRHDGQMRHQAVVVAAVTVCIGLAGCTSTPTARPTAPYVAGSAPTTTLPPDVGGETHFSDPGFETPPTTKSSVDLISGRTCSGSQLASRVTSGGGEASQPYLIIEVANNGLRCSIEGYPRIVEATGHTLQGRSQPLSISVSDGPDYEHPDPGPHPLSLQRGGSASFAVGTNTASGTTYIVTSMTISLPSGQGALVVPVHTGASALVGKAVHIEVTALVNGSQGPQTG